MLGCQDGTPPLTTMGFPLLPAYDTKIHLQPDRRRLTDDRACGADDVAGHSQFQKTTFSDDCLQTERQIWEWEWPQGRPGHSQASKKDMWSYVEKLRQFRCAIHTDRSMPGEDLAHVGLAASSRAGSISCSYCIISAVNVSMNRFTAGGCGISLIASDSSCVVLQADVPCGSITS